MCVPIGYGLNKGAPMEQAINEFIQRGVEHGFVTSYEQIDRLSIDRSSQREDRFQLAAITMEIYGFTFIFLRLQISSILSFFYAKLCPFAFTLKGNGCRRFQRMCPMDCFPCAANARALIRNMLNWFSTKVRAIIQNMIMRFTLHM